MNDSVRPPSGELSHEPSSPLPADLFEGLMHSDVALTVVDARLPGLPIVLANAAYARLSGYTPDEALGRHWQFLQGPLTDEHAAARLAAALAQGRAESVDMLNYRRDGSLFWNRIVLAPAGGDPPAPGPTLVIHTDVTLSHQGALQRDAGGSLIDPAPVGAIVIGEWNWDILHDRVYTDERYATYFSVPGTRALLGASHHEFLEGIDAHDRERVTAELHEAVRLQGPFHSEFRVLMNGETRWLASRGLCQPDSDGVARRFPGITWDITDLKRAEQVLHDSAVELRLLADALPALIAYVDAQQRFRFNNQAHLDWYGLAPRDLYGKTVREVLGERVYAARRPHFEAALAGKVARFEDESPHRDGTIHQASLQYIPRRLHDGQVSGCYVLVHDITDHKRAEERLRAHGDRMDALVNQASVGILQIDLDGRIVMANERFATLIGRPAPLLVGHQALEFMEADDVAPGYALLTTLIETGEPGLIESRFLRPDGTPVWVSSHLSLLRDDEGRPQYASIVVTDISARKTAQRRQAALLELGDRLRELSDTAEINGTAARILSDTCGVGRAGFGEVDPTGLHVTIERDWTAGASGISIAGVHRFPDYGEFFARLQHGETVIIPDVLRDPQTAGWADKLVGADIRALLNVPLMEQGRLVALLFLHHDAPRQWDADELDFVRNVADRTWAALKRASADQALKKLNETLEQRVAQRTADLDRMWRLSTDVMLVAGFDFRITALNPAWEVTLGWRTDQLRGSHFPDLLHPDDQEQTLRAMARLSKGLATLQFENRCRHVDGSFRWLSWRAAADDVGIHAVGRDITAEKDAAEALRHTEDQLRQAQKMEAVGQLTGGIAHDFNNILQGVIGPLDLIRRSIQLGRLDNLGRFIETATASAKRASALTHRLLAFSRRQALDLRPVDVNDLVGSLEDLLRRTLGESIALTITREPDLWPALTDANQLENALLNLVINARDAMPEGGGLDVSTRNLVVREPQEQEGLRAGDYVLLSVADTGIGMTPAVIAKAFDPFFTTKPVGQGTGLGLSMIYGFAKQSNGHVHIASRVGVGTRVELYLPRCAPASTPDAESPVLAHDALGDGETVLVVEDDPAVRLVVVEVLEGLGYRVLQAADGALGLEIVKSDARLDLMVSDVGMPNLNGRELAALSRQVRPTLPVLFMTGYAGNAVVRSGFLDAGMDMIAKPFALDALAAKVREMLVRR